MSTATAQEWQHDFNDERDLLREVALALRSLRCGSVVLTVHDGRIIEVNKTERIRKSSAEPDANGPLPHIPKDVKTFQVHAGSVQFEEARARLVDLSS